jgi:hypothetical protein
LFSMSVMRTTYYEQDTNWQNYVHPISRIATAFDA